MAPTYAPNLRKHQTSLVLLLEAAFIAIFFFFVNYEDDNVNEKRIPLDIYAEFQDVHVMVFFGFGFLMMFLRRYGFSSTGFNLLLAALAVQWATLMNGFLFSFRDGSITINLKSLVTANMCAASAVISMGAVLGKSNPIQLILMTLLEVSGFIFNCWILKKVLNVDLHVSILHLHVFGAFFGLMMTWALSLPGKNRRHEKEKESTTTSLFSMLGTIFLWMFWPSFNSAFVEKENEKMYAVYNTYFGMAVSAVTTFAVSVITSRKGQLNMAHIHSAVLAGGVAVSATAMTTTFPWIAMTLGFTAGVISVLGYQYAKPMLDRSFSIHDTCGVLWIHGFPGIIGVLTKVIITLVMAENIRMILKDSFIEYVALSVTLALSLVLGMITGFLLKCKWWKPVHFHKHFDDQAYWEFPHLAMKL
ncbi:rh blood group, D antigen [Polypterus senegalus]|uniref:rh blood group, D antigen n=1 Tax=Polypterus senegalus TaxID=55291 RepID=UPI001966CCE6|nr:rh blood group, D antigen [Polypterus senegalus]